MFVPGEGPRPCRLMFVGEAPGYHEDLAGRPFVGRTGEELNRFLRWIDLVRALVFITNLYKLRPPNNEDPTPDEIRSHESYLIEELRDCQPEIIVTLGRLSTYWFLDGEYARKERGHEHVDMLAVHSIPHPVRRWWDPSDGTPAIVLPIYHPAFGLHQPNTQRAIELGFERLRALLDGAIPDHPPVDIHAGKEWYHDLRDGRHVPQMLPLPGARDLIALDTEGVPSSPWGVSACSVVASSLVARPSYPEALAAIARHAKGNVIIAHNLPWDIPVLERLGIPIEDGLFHDTMVMAYLLSADCSELYPQALKPLAYRELGMEMEDFPDLVREPNERMAREFIERLLREGACRACFGVGKVRGIGKKGQKLSTLRKCEVCCGDGTRWPEPDPLLVWENGKSKVYQPQGVGKRMRRALKDFRAGKPVDLRERWGNIEEEIRMPAEDDLGEMPEADLDDVVRYRAVGYSARDADATLRIYMKLQPEIERMGLERVQEIDEAVLPMIARMERVGMKIDPAYFYDLSKAWASEMYLIGKQIESMVGYWVNPSSSKQVANLLFEHLKLPPVKLTKSREGESTDDKVLEQLKLTTKHPVLEPMTDYRELNKLKGTYAEKMPRKMDRRQRVHPRIRTTRTATGRPSSYDPNLLNIPVRSERGKLISKGFIARAGCVLGGWDLSQIEMRVLAHESGDENLIALFRDEQTCPIYLSSPKRKCRCHDMHIFGATKVFRVSADDVTDDDRTSAKNVGFGIVYGITAEGLKAQMDVRGQTFTLEECEQMIALYLDEAFPGIKTFMEDKAAEARRLGYVEDMFGRKRYMSAVRSSAKWVMYEALRQAGNFPIQSGAAGIMKLMMARVWREVLPEFWDRGFYIECLISVYDSLIFELEDDEGLRAELDERMQGIIRSTIELSVPITGSGSWGKTWADLK